MDPDPGADLVLECIFYDKKIENKLFMIFRFFCSVKLDAVNTVHLEPEPTDARRTSSATLILTTYPAPELNFKHTGTMFFLFVYFFVL